MCVTLSHIQNLKKKNFSMELTIIETSALPKYFLKSFQQHPLEYGQNGKCVASDVRGGDLSPWSCISCL